jgi:hypothetical protein
MKRFAVLLLTAGLALAAVLPAAAQASGVGLGLSAGAAFPLGSTTGALTNDGMPSFNWGFYVDIPLIYTFHLTPSSELYRFASQNATDFDIAFKFIVPLGGLSLFGGFSPGLTAVSDVLAAHVGALAGGSFKLVSNLDAFFQAKWVYIFTGAQNVPVLHANAGILFTF